MGLPSLMCGEWFATSYMVGVIWLIQAVHYPAFRFVEAARFPEFARFHQRRMSWIVAIPMCVELGFCFVNAVLFPGFRTALGLVLLLGIWGVTFLVSVPCHQRLLLGTDPRVIEKLISTNWWRTVLWSVRWVGMTA
jgi:hypothetical protein